MISERIESGWIRDRLRSWGLNYEMTKRQRRGDDSLPFPRSEWTVLLQRCGWAHSFAKRPGKFGTISLLFVNWKHKPSVAANSWFKSHKQLLLLLLLRRLLRRRL